jgi:apolipoprotein N-acyltransferase
MGALNGVAMRPDSWWWLSWLSMCGLMALWLRSASTAVLAAALGLVYGLALNGVTTSWLPTALWRFPDAPDGIKIGATLFAWAYCAAPWVLAGWAQALCARCGPCWRVLAAVPLGLVLGWWCNTWVFGGLPWMAPAYGFLDTVFTGFLPVGGYLLASLAIMWAAGCTVLAWHVYPRWLLAAVSLPLVGLALQQVVWTHQVGATVKVGIVQTRARLDFAQTNEAVQSLHAMNLRISEALVKRDRVDVVVWPEAGFRGSAQAWRAALADGLKREFADTALVLGMLVDDIAPGPQRAAGAALYNVALAGGPSSSGVYVKRHLLPFGEYWPKWLPRADDVPSEVTAGEERQPPIIVKGQPVAASICFDDAYAEPFADVEQPPAWLVNLSNDAWFDANMAQQHLGLSRARAIELGRFTVRAANVGPSAIIAPNGKVLAQTPHDQTSMLAGSVTPLQGLTPFARWGNAGVLALCALLVIALAGQYRRCLK